MREQEKETKVRKINLAKGKNCTEKGITMIVLVVTIVLLIILSGVALNLTLGENGIIMEAKKKREELDIIRIQENLEIARDELAIKEYGKLDVNKYLDKIINDGIIEESDIDRNHQESVDITVEGKYVFLVEKEEPNKIKIEYLGIAKDILPKIEVLSINSRSNSITVKLNLKYTENYKLYIKENGKEYKKEKEEIVNKKEVSYTFNNLKQTTVYSIKIEAFNKNGKTEKEITKTTGTVTTAIGNIIFTLNPNTWTNGNVTATASTGVTEFTLQTSKDGNNWSTTATQTFTANGTIYARLVDSTNQYNGTASTQITIIDKSAPGATSISYAGGANTCSWKNNYNINLSATDIGSGIAHYEIDWDGDGNANTTTGSNFVPWNGYSSCNTRFRAVDRVGNKGPWTDVQHIHMDTEAPKHTNWWWGEVTKDVARLYIQTTDNVGISRVQCPTSTQSGGFNNWHWYNAVWDAGANAYRCDITPSTFGHYGQTYKTHLYIYDHAENGGYYNQTSCNIPIKNVHPVGTAWDFGYTGGVQSFTVKDTGTYKLEVWGAQGGNHTASGYTEYGGNGGYSYGNKVLTAGTTIYIAVGGAGAEVSTGGYNGGGTGLNASQAAGGGGATHIATTNRGVLSNYASYKSEVIIVAGGGGGGGGSHAYDIAASYAPRGGAGGGINGQSGYGTGGNGYGQGATQTSGGSGSNSGGFGYGGTGSGVDGGGGGGGWYGGGAGMNWNGGLPGGGGSGYIGGVTNGSTSNGQRSGNGYARITFTSN